jgi:hypothetical protein
MGKTIRFDQVASSVEPAGRHTPTLMSHKKRVHMGLVHRKAMQRGVIWIRITFFQPIAIF